MTKRIGKGMVEAPIKKLIKVVKNRNESEVMELSAEKLIPSQDLQQHSEKSLHPSRSNSASLGMDFSRQSC